MSHFEIVVSSLRAREHGKDNVKKQIESGKFQKNHAVEFSVKWFETGNKHIYQQYLDSKLNLTEHEITKLGYDRVAKFKNHQGEDIKKGILTKALTNGRYCKVYKHELNGTLSELKDSDEVDEHKTAEVICTDLEILSDSTANRKPY